MASGDAVPPSALLADAYGAFAALVREVDDGRSWLPTQCEGWSVRDVVLHCQWDAQRGLVALHTPADRPADRDRVSYWSGWGSDPVASANGRRFIRVMAGMFRAWPRPARSSTGCWAVRSHCRGTTSVTPAPRRGGRR